MPSKLKLDTHLALYFGSRPKQALWALTGAVRLRSEREGEGARESAAGVGVGVLPVLVSAVCEWGQRHLQHEGGGGGGGGGTPTIVTGTRVSGFQIS